MKIIKIVLIAIAAVIALALVTALIVPKTYEVQRTVTINKPKAEVFGYIRFLKNQDNYSKWAGMDPEMKKSYRGTDGEVGFVSAWESNNPDVGKGEQEIKKISEGERIDYELRFFEPFQSTEPAYMVTESISDNETKVTWGFNGHMDYPMNLMLLFMDFEKMIGDDFQTGLDKLKVILEK